MFKRMFSMWFAVNYKKMGFFGFGKSNGIIGVDIGTASIKIVELESEKNRFKLKNYGLFELTGTEDAIQAKQKTNRLGDKDIIWGIKKTIKEAKIKSKNVVASIPSYSSFATIIKMPYLSKEDIAKAIPFEARKYIPLPLNEVNLDWSIVDVGDGATQGESKTPEVEVFLAAVSKDETMRYQTIMKESGLTLKALELENMSLIRSLIGNDRNPLTIVNIGGRSTSITVIDKGFERVSHSYEFGGFEITKSISRSMKINLKRAEELKRRVGLGDSESGIVNDAMVSLIDMMIFETRKTISGYESEKKIKINNVLLVGGLTNMPKFVDYFKNKIGLNVQIGNPFSRIIIPDSFKSIASELGTVFAVSAGLAMRDI